jgi:hypothetical protein
VCKCKKLSTTFNVGNSDRILDGRMGRQIVGKKRRSMQVGIVESKRVHVDGRISKGRSVTGAHEKDGSRYHVSTRSQRMLA